MMKTHVDIIERLKQLGLTEKEAMVYIALLPHAQVGTSVLMRATGLHGQYVYSALEVLEAKNLVFHVVRNGRKKFQAAPPQHMMHVLEEKIVQANIVINQLESLSKRQEPDQFEVYVGQAMYVARQFDLLEKAPPKSVLRIIGGQNEVFARMLGPRKAEYERKRKEKDIAIRYLGSESQQTELRDTASRLHRFDYRILPGYLAGYVNTDIWSEHLALTFLGEPVRIATIKSRDMAQGYEQFFEAVWSGSVV